LEQHSTLLQNKHLFSKARKHGSILTSHVLEWEH